MIHANNETDVVEAVRDARENRRSLEIVSAGTKRNYGRVTACGDILDVSGLRGIVKYEPSELILTVLPGTSVAEINALLAEKNQRLGFEPADWGPLLGAPAGKATIGGVLSADANGSAAVRYGRARDSLLGYHAVNGFGEAYKAGGKVVKNVTGFDLPKLMCGAMGTLGVLTEVTLRVFPKPERSHCFVVKNVTRFRGCTLLRRAWSGPLEATGLSYVPAVSASMFAELGDIGSGAALFRLEGSRAALAEKDAMLRELLADEEPFEIKDGDGIFRKIGSGETFRDTAHDIWRTLSQPFSPQDREEPVREAPSHPWIADCAGAVSWRAYTSGVDLNECSPDGGVLVRASEETRRRAHVFRPEIPARAALTKSVKAAFDPLGIFNPGRMWAGV